MIGIYKIENLINHKIYIGQSINIEFRWQRHRQTMNEKSDASKRPLYCDMRKYGIENFSFEVVEECSQEELAEREVYWVSYYDSFNNGYNLTRGGHVPTKVDIEKLHRLWDEGYTTKEIKEIKEILNVNPNTVRKHLEGYSDYNAHTSRSRSARKSEAIMNPKKKRNELQKQICQYDLNGQIIAYWDSVRQAMENTGATSIGECLKGRFFSSGGYRWGYKDEPLPTKASIKNRSKANKLNEIAVEEIKALLLLGISQPKIAEQYSVSRWAVSEINTGKHWNDGGIYPIYDYKNKKANR